MHEIVNRYVMRQFGKVLTNTLIHAFHLIRIIITIRKKTIIGMLILHVDDLLGGGEKKFYAKVIDPLMKKFPFGEMQTRNFRFTGINIEDVPEGLYLDQRHYIENLKEVPIDRAERMG